MLSCLSASLPEKTSDVSITVGGIAKIPCPFDEGAVRNIYWYYHEASGLRRILSLAKYVEEIDAAYTDRAGLDKDNSTLILQEVTIDDEGTYRCDVDRLGQPALLNITTTLSVFVLSPGTPPVIRQCLQEQPDGSPCTLTSEGSTNLTCQLSNVYPITDLSLGWYQDGLDPMEAPFLMSETKEDGSIDLETNFEAFETGKWLCKASYLSAYGIEQTSASISLTILETNDTGSPMDPVKIVVPTCIIVVALAVIVIIVRRRRNRRLEANGQYGEIKPAEKVELGDKVYGSKPQTSPPAAVGAANSNDKSSERIITDRQILKLSKLMPLDKLNAFCVALELGLTYAENVSSRHQLNSHAAFEEVLKRWKGKTKGRISDLDDALRDAECLDLIDRYKE